MDFYAGGNKDYIAHLCSTADVLCVQEAKDFVLRDLVPDGWTAYQDTSSDAKQGAGIAVASTVKVDKWGLVKGCDAPQGGGMLPRWIVWAEARWEEGGVFTPISAHEPPGRYDHLQPGFTNNLQKVANSHPDPTIGVDANMPINTLANQLGSGYKAVGEGIIGILAKTPLTDVEIDKTGMADNQTDHPAVAASKG